MRRSSPSPSDRREYFRIDDQVSMRYRITTEAEMHKALENRAQGYPDANAIASTFLTTGLEMKHALDRCRRSLPEVASYLEGLNTKLDVLMRLVIATHSDLPDSPSHEVNISASGVAFRSTEDVPGGALLEITLLFFPSFLYLLAFGRVIRCVRAEGREFPYAVAVEFCNLSDGDRDLIIRHVLQKESEMLRRVRQDPVSNA